MNKESLNNKKTMILLICIIILLIAILGIILFFTLNKEKSDNNSLSNTKQINKVYNDKDLVYCVYSKSIEDYSYSIPCINLDSSEVKKINKNIEDEYKTFAEEESRNVYKI